MSIVNKKALRTSLVGFVDFVDPRDAVEENEEAADQAGVCTWPVCKLRKPCTPKDEEEESNATRTPENDAAHSDIGELENTGELQIEVRSEEAFFEVGTDPSSAANAEANTIPSPAANAEGGLWLDDTDPVSPCALSMWQTAAASFYLPSPQGTPSGLGPSPMTAAEPMPVEAEPSFLPANTAAWPRAGAAAAREAQLLASSLDAAADTRIRRLHQLRDVAAALPAASASQPRAFGHALPVTLPLASKVGSPTSPYTAGNALMTAASAGPLPLASWAAPHRSAALAPQMLPPARKVAAPAKVKSGQSGARGAQGRQGFQREDPNRLERRRHPARQRPAGEQVGPIEPLEERTTIMLRNIPNDYTRDMLHELIVTRGFGGACDFLYLPMDFHTQSNLGYAFVNLERAEDAWNFWQVFEGFSKWAVRSKKVASLRMSECQGLEANVKRYRNSPVMGDAVPDCHKPAVYTGGERAEFPAPTKLLRAPRIKRGGQK